MEAAITSETSLYPYQNTRQNNSEDSHLIIHCCTSLDRPIIFTECAPEKYQSKNVCTEQKKEGIWVDRVSDDRLSKKRKYSQFPKRRLWPCKHIARSASGVSLIQRSQLRHCRSVFLFIAPSSSAVGPKTPPAHATFSGSNAAQA